MQENNTAEDQTILVVDDDIEIRTELVAFFNRYGHSAKAAYSGSEARNIISKSTIAIAIVDVVMPEENGLELTKWIVNNTEIAVILLTSLDSPYEKIVGLELGADDYVTKPFEPRELLARVRSVLRRKKEPSPP